jgi:hypothetical protein
MPEPKHSVKQIVEDFQRAIGAETEFREVIFLPPSAGHDILALEEKAGVPVPAELARLYRETGAFRDKFFGDDWQTIYLFSPAELAGQPLGLASFIDFVWGGRPELVQWLSSEQRHRLDTSYAVFGYRYENDNVHDYLYFDAGGGFGHFHFNQDSSSRMGEALRALAQNGGGGMSLELLLTKQFEIILGSLDD